jgi:hypothetical protein
VATARCLSKTDICGSVLSILTKTVIYSAMFRDFTLLERHTRTRKNYKILIRSPYSVDTLMEHITVTINSRITERKRKDDVADGFVFELFHSLK